MTEEHEPSPLAHVAPASDRRLAVRLSPAGLRAVRSNHPWVFDGAIRSVSHDGNAGDLAVVFDDERRFNAIGLWDPDSPIRLRVLHRGSPQTIDGAFFAARIEEAWTRRAPLRSLGDDGGGVTNGWRWINGENDAMGGLIADHYNDTVVVKLYSAAWFPWLSDVVGALATRTSRVVLRLARVIKVPGARVGLHDGMVLHGPALNGPVSFQENGLWFLADVERGHKTGHFLDQRDNRDRVRSHSRDAAVLDVFSSTGGFAIYAGAGGARSVDSVDVSGPALEAARQNWSLNVDAGLIDPSVTWRPHVADAFETMQRFQRVGDRFDVVVVDPPSFVSGARDRRNAFRAYERLVDLAVPLVAPHGLLVTASCSSRIELDEYTELVAAVVDDSGRRVADTQTFGHADDHPVTFPEGAYLKAVFTRLSD